MCRELGTYGGGVSCVSRVGYLWGCCELCAVSWVPVGVV